MKKDQVTRVKYVNWHFIHYNCYYMCNKTVCSQSSELFLLSRVSNQLEKMTQQCPIFWLGHIRIKRCQRTLPTSIQVLRGKLIRRDCQHSCQQSKWVGELLHLTSIHHGTAGAVLSQSPTLSCTRIPVSMELVQYVLKNLNQFASVRQLCVRFYLSHKYFTIWVV